MDKVARHLIERFDALPEAERREVLEALLRRAADLPYSFPSDDELVHAGALSRTSHTSRWSPTRYFQYPLSGPTQASPSRRGSPPEINPVFDEFLDALLVLPVELAEGLFARRQELNPPGHAGA